MRHKSLLTLAFFASVVFFTAVPGWTQDKAALPDVDGTIWMQSTSAEKRAFLFGAGSAVVLEYFIRSKHNEQPSRFVQGWVDVFKDQSWADMEKSLDHYYSSNPDKRSEHVFHVIWSQMIKPNLKD